MRKASLGFSLLVLAVSLACGRGQPVSTGESDTDEPVSTTQGEAGDVGFENEGMVSPLAVAACGGFTVEDTASILGVSASELEDRSEDSSENLRLCSFWHSESMEGVSFYLSVSDSVARAVDEMEQGRGMAGFAQTTIDQTTGTESQEEALEGVEAIGEEAYFMEVNGTLNVRVGNIQIQVLPMEDREQMKEVGRIVATGLSES